MTVKAILTPAHRSHPITNPRVVSALRKSFQLLGETQSLTALRVAFAQELAWIYNGPILLGQMPVGAWRELIAMASR